MSISVTGNTIKFSKPFSQEEQLIAGCLGFEVFAHQAECDISKTSKVAVFEFMKWSFPFYIQKKDSPQSRLLFAQIKEAYDRDYNKFMSEFKLDELYGGERTLDQYQIDAIYTMRNRKANLFAAAMGVGKTVISASLSKMNNYPRTVVVTIAGPKFSYRDDLCTNWGYEDTTFTILDSVKSTHSFLYEKFIIVNYESVSKGMKYLVRENVDLIIFDECEKMKNTSSLLFKEARKLVHKFPKAKLVFMSGTPIRNTVVDMFAYLNLSGHPLGEKKDKFKEMFWDAKAKRAKNIDLFRVCTANFTLRILSEDVIELPELNINKTYLQNSQSGKDYEDILEGMYNANQRFKWLDEEIKRMTSGEKLDRESIMLLKAYQKEKNELRIAKGSNVMKLNRMNSINKVGDAIKAIEEQIRKGEKVAVFSYFTDVVLALYTHFGSKAVLIDGSVNSRTRMDFINKFHKDPKTKLFIGQHTAAGAGINLYNACKGFVMDLPFVPSVLNQIVKRLHRRGQVSDVDFNLLMVKDSIDDHIFNNILAGKDADTNEILDKDNPKVVALRELGNKELVFDALVDNYKLKKELA